MSGAAIMVAVLAAGSSQRFGSDKRQALLGGRPLAHHALETARRAADALQAECIAIVPADGGLAMPPRITARANSDSARGMGTSVAMAARLAQEAGCDTLVVTLADMPFVRAQTLVRLMKGRMEKQAAACLHPGSPRHSGPRPGLRPGPPAVFDARHFAALQQLEGERGAGALLARLAGEGAVHCLAADTLAPHELTDIDTPQALARAEALLADG
ncbi:Molybdenum cofactor cytidylyltransferase [Alteripontixanthobacter maritimus]|uniref:Molybdenum cofactor cytidylyltransferase n=1 Tax=Alteripontixanthobacter maritimus TaxID=2161824 RepID=A0A369QDD9_9SPHN|nr:NTP transferase domain-containing protein [Alteripontixanthobacter maritimus]RDC60298.1 Molybdenum cofactor cytidylyltransferase [Alteripontixanthobacter maritimus]